MKTKAQIIFAVTAKLISAFVFTTRIVQFLFFLNPKFQASSHFLRQHRPVCVIPVRKPHCWLSYRMAHIYTSKLLHGPDMTSDMTGLVQKPSRTDKVIKITNYDSSETALQMSRAMTKPTSCICENKGADQLRSHCEADQGLCFRYTNSTVPLQLKSEISRFSLFSVTVQVGLCRTWSEPHCWFSYEADQMKSFV